LVYVTGDVHGYFGRIGRFCSALSTSFEDVLVVLGDACVNFWGDEADTELKRRISRYPVTMLLVHGNHEMRPSPEMGYREMPWHGGDVYVQEEFPSLLFAKDGSVFDLEGSSCLVAGGAFSIDKEFRLADGRRWFSDEQPGPVQRANVERSCEHAGWRIDYVFSHTCPIERRPREAFLARVNQASVDTSTEEWLSGIAERLAFRRWFHGHFHVDRYVDDDMWTLFKDVVELQSGRKVYDAKRDAAYCGENATDSPPSVASGFAAK
jgi:hypothetical protein